MAESVLKKREYREVSVLVVWVPMIPTDDQDAARREARRLDDRRVHHFWDSQRLLGTTLNVEVFPNAAKETLKSLPEDHFLREHLEEKQDQRASERAMWDIALFYRPGTEWIRSVPKPTRWSKQVAFSGTKTRCHSAFFWRDSVATPPVESDWKDELVRGLQGLSEFETQVTCVPWRCEKLSFFGVPDLNP